MDYRLILCTILLHFGGSCQFAEGAPLGMIRGGNIGLNHRPRFFVPRGDPIYYNKDTLWEILYFLKFGVFPANSRPTLNQAKMKRLKFFKSILGQSGEGGSGEFRDFQTRESPEEGQIDENEDSPLRVSFEQGSSEGPFALPFFRHREVGEEETDPDIKSNGRSLEFLGEVGQDQAEQPLRYGSVSKEEAENSASEGDEEEEKYYQPESRTTRASSDKSRMSQFLSGRQTINDMRNYPNYPRSLSKKEETLQDYRDKVSKVKLPRDGSIPRKTFETQGW